MGFRVGTEILSLDPSVMGQGQGGFIYSPGKAETPYKLTLSPQEAGSKVAELLLAMRSSDGKVGGKSLADLVNTTSWARCDATARGWTVALSNDTAAIDDSANGGVGSGARILGTSGDVGVMLKRARISRTTLLDSLRGWERWFLRVRTSGGSKWELSPRWGASLADPVNETNPTVRHDTSPASAFGYVELDLGNIRLPDEGTLGGVALELWARRVSGTGDLHMNLIRLLPATPGEDVLTRITVPLGVAETWLGSDLVTPTNPAGFVAGTTDGTDLLLDADEEGGGTPPNGGLTWGPHRHVVTFHVTRGFPTGHDLWLQVRNITDSTTVVSKQLSAGTGGVFDLAFDGVAGKAYQAQVRLDVISGPGLHRVHWIRHSVLPLLAQSEQAHTDPESDPESGIVKRDSNGAVLSILEPEGPVPFRVRPRLAAVFAVALDVPKAGYTEAESVKARTVTLSAIGAPRHPG